MVKMCCCNSAVKFGGQISLGGGCRPSVHLEESAVEFRWSNLGGLISVVKLHWSKSQVDLEGSIREFAQHGRLLRDTPSAGAGHRADGAAATGHRADCVAADSAAAAGHRADGADGAAADSAAAAGHRADGGR